jgi:4-diphosphocytidyl-2-C-methyl-D-erythritol kinase
MDISAMFSSISPAKLNLSLEVNDLLTNGLHNITSVMHTLSLSDKITINYSDEIKSFFLPTIINNMDNSIIDTIILFKNKFNIHESFEVVIKKEIPISAGLGGGSSNSSTVLKLLIDIAKLKLSTTDILELALQLSSDSPFFICSGCALVEGIGGDIKTTSRLKNLWAVIITPINISIENKTKHMYSLLTDKHYTNGAITTEIFNSLSQPNANNIQILKNSMNTFEYVIDDIFSEYKDLKKKFLDMGAPFVRLSGSGPSFFSIFDNFDQANIIATNMENNNLRIIVTQLD